MKRWEWAENRRSSRLLFSRCNAASHTTLQTQSMPSLLQWAYLKPWANTSVALVKWITVRRKVLYLNIATSLAPSLHIWGTCFLFSLKLYIIHRKLINYSFSSSSSSSSIAAAAAAVTAVALLKVPQGLIDKIVLQIKALASVHSRAHLQDPQCSKAVCLVWFFNFSLTSICMLRHMHSHIYTSMQVCPLSPLSLTHTYK